MSDFYFPGSSGAVHSGLLDPENPIDHDLAVRDVARRLDPKEEI